MKTEITKNELFNEVSKFYTRAVNVNKALTLYEMEYGYRPEIIERKNLVNEKFIKSMNYPEYVTPEALTFMKDLQDSGVVNMIMSVSNIQAGLHLNLKDARELLKIYMKDYIEIYYPEQLI
jgi:hypothetical protein